MKLNPYAIIRLGDFNSPAFYLVGAVHTRTRVHNFTADFPCDVGDAMGASCEHVNKSKLIFSGLALLTVDRLFEVEVKISRITLTSCNSV